MSSRRAFNLEEKIQICSQIKMVKRIVSYVKNVVSLPQLYLQFGNTETCGSMGRNTYREIKK